MTKPSRNNKGVLQWAVVLVVGIVVIAIVVGLNLISRLDAGQKVLNAARPAFVHSRVVGARAGINAISRNVNMADPIVTPAGGGAAEVPALVAYVAKKEKMTDAEAAALVKKLFPHTAALLGAVPLSSVTQELPGLVVFLSKELKITPAQVMLALAHGFPALATSIVNLPPVTSGWNLIPGINGFTNFAGNPIRSVPQARTYFSSDLVPVLEKQEANFHSLDGTTRVNWIAPVLLDVGIIAVLLAAFMIWRNLNGVKRSESIGASIAVVIVGAAVVALVLSMNLIPRLSDGQKLLDGLEPAMAQNRVEGDRTAINMVSTITTMENPIMTARGGAAAEVPALLELVSQKTGLSQAQVLAALEKEFPHTAALLQAIPLSAVSAELPAVVRTLGPEAIPLIPHLAQTIVNAPLVTAGWNQIPGAPEFTRFSGFPVNSVPQVSAYFSDNVIPVLETQRTNYDHLISKSKIDFLGPLVLAIGIIVFLFGLLMVALAWRMPKESKPTDSSEDTPSRTPAHAVV